MAKKNTEFGIRLRELREEAGVSMIQLGKAIGVSDAAVCKWENGLAEPKAGYIAKLAEYFDCTADYLIGIDGGFTARAVGKSNTSALKVIADDGKTVVGMSGTPGAETLTSNERELIDTFRGLSPAGKKLARAAIDAWASTKDGETEADGKEKPDPKKA